jgi:hypothetical protein
MINTPLLLGLPTDPITLGLDILAGILGVTIGYVAFQAYQDNKSLPMLFVAAGFLMAFVVPVVLVGALAVLDAGVSFSTTLESALPWAIQVAGRVSEVTGLVLILYGLAMPLRR